MENSSLEEEESVRIVVPKWIYLIGIILLIVLGFGIFLRYFYTRTPGVLDFSTSEYQPTYNWEGTTLVPGSTAVGYEFPVTSNSNGFLSITPATLNYTKLSNPSEYGIGVTDPYSCIDLDQLNAILVQHTCGNLPTSIDRDNANSGCYKIDGTLAQWGDTEDYYLACSPSGSLSTDTLYCPGQVGGVAVDFNLNQQTGTFDNMYCLQRTGETSVSASSCDLTDPDYQFRIILTTPQSWPGYSTSYGSSGMSGNLARFVHRATGLCVDVGNTGNTGQQGLILRDCGTTYNYGYTWQLFPPTNLGCSTRQKTNAGNGSNANIQTCHSDKLNEDGSCDNFDGCPIISLNDLAVWSAQPVPGDKEYSIYSYFSMSPQQIVYIGYSNGAEQTAKFTNNNSVANFFYDNNGMSITYDGNVVLTKPFSRWAQWSNYKGEEIINNLIFNAQTASFLTYNVVRASSFMTPFGY